MKVRVTQHITSYRTLRDLEPGTIIDVPAEWADQLVRSGLAEKAWTGPVEPRPAGIDPELAGWLVEHGFTKNPEGTAYLKIVKVSIE